MFNYADDNTISAFSNSIPHLQLLLEAETKKALKWLGDNKMIANPEKFHCIILTKDKALNSDIEIKIGDKRIKSEKSVRLLGVTIDNQLNFDKHISEVCKKSSTQLNALYRFTYLLSSEAKRVLLDSFIFSNFNYCPLVWHFSSSKSINKVESIQKRALRFLQPNPRRTYNELLAETKRFSMMVNRLKVLCIEIFKTIKDLNPPYMRDIFQVQDRKRQPRFKHANNLQIPWRQSETFSTKSVSFLGPRIWNNLCPVMKTCKSISLFKSLIKKMGWHTLQMQTLCS